MLLAFRAFNGPMLVGAAVVMAVVQSWRDSSVRVPALSGRDTELVLSWLLLLALGSMLAFSLRHWRAPTVRRGTRPVGCAPALVTCLAVAAAACTYRVLDGPHGRAYLGALLCTVGLTALVFAVASPIASAGVTACLLLCSIAYGSDLPLADHLRVLDVSSTGSPLWLGAALLTAGVIALTTARRSSVDWADPRR